MKSKLLVGLLLCVAASGRAQNVEWLHQYGTSAQDFANGICVDSTGVYVAGQAALSLPGQTTAGALDAYIRKYDDAGNILWTRQFGTSGNEDARAVACDGVSVYLVGGTDNVLPGQSRPPGVVFGNSAYVRKYDVNGTEQWTRQFASISGTTSGDVATGVALDSTGVYVAGQGGNLPGQTGAGGNDIWVRKYDANGNEIWTRQFGSNGTDVGQSAAVDSSGLYFVGYVGGVIAGQSSAGNNDVFIRKFSFDGGELWTRQFGTANEDRGQGVAADGASAYIVGSIFFGAALPGQTSSGAHDAFVRRYDRTGNILWTRQFGTTGNDQGFAAAADNSGVYVAGTTAGAFPGSTQTGLGDAFIRKYSPEGTELWTRQIGSFGQDTSKSLSLGASSLYTAGDTAGAFPGQTRIGFTDSFIAKVLLPSGPVVFDGGVVHNASFAAYPAPVAPGSIAAIFGTNLNDGSSVLFSSYGPDGKLVTSLGGATVKVNDVSAPMFYSTPGQLGIQIPFEMAGQTSATVQVTVGGQTSLARTFFIDPVAPGIFTANQQGNGIAAVLHQDGVIPVSAQNPAHPGEVLIFFGTGFGLLTPALTTGAPSSGNRTAVDATATVDGLAATVEFSGTAPGFVGLNQINVRIPPGTRTASDIAVVIRIGGKQSNQVTIPVSP